MEDRKLPSNLAKNVQLHHLLDSDRNHSAYDHRGGDERECRGLAKSEGSSNSSDEDLQLCDNLQRQLLMYLAENPGTTRKFSPNPDMVVFPNSELHHGVQEDVSVMTLTSDFTGPLPSSLQNTHLTLTDTPFAPSSAERPAGTLKTTAAAAVTLSVGGWPWPAITEDDDDDDDDDDDAQDKTLDAGEGITQMIDDDSAQELPTSMLAAVKLNIEADNQEKRAAAAVARSMVETTDKDHAPPAPSNLMDFEVHKGDSIMKKATKRTNTTLSDDKPPSKGMEVISLSFTPPPTYKVWLLPPVEKSYSKNSINLGMYLHDESQSSIEFTFDLSSDNPVHVAQEMAKMLDEVPYDDVGEICTAIKNAVQEARMKLNQGVLAYDTAVSDADLARKLGEASVTENQINPCSTISDQCNLASNRVPSLLAEQGGANSNVGIRSRFGSAVHPPAEDNALNGVPNDAVLNIRTAISDAVREARMEQNQGTLMQQSTFDTLLAMQLQFIEDAGIRGRNRDVDIHPWARRAVDPPTDDNARAATEEEGVVSVSAGTILEADCERDSAIVLVATLVEDEEIYLATRVTPPEPKCPWWKRRRSKLFRRKAA